MTLNRLQRQSSVHLDNLTTTAEDAPGALQPHSVPIVPARLWEDLVAGRFVVVGYQNTDRCCYVDLEHSMDGARPALPTRQRAMLEQLLAGDCSKVLALDARCSPSTVSVLLRDALRHVGVTAGPRQVPLFLVMLAHAAHCTESIDRFDTRLVKTDAHHSLLIMSRTDSDRLQRLSASERDVVRGMLEGHSQSTLAEHRRTATRTIANQVASAYAKFGVSGRLAFIRELVK